MFGNTIFDYYLEKIRNRPLKVLIRLCIKKVYQAIMRYYRRFETLLNIIPVTDEQVTKAALHKSCDISQLIEHFDTKRKPLFYWTSKDRERIVSIVQNLYPETIPTTIQEADQICNHIFDLLGSGRYNLGKDIDWHRDFKSGYRWPAKFYSDIVQVNLYDNSDIKVPWELSRCHHFVTLGKAYWYTQDEKYADEFVYQLTDWIEKNPPRIGVNWCNAMEAAIRIVNWIWGYQFFASSPTFDRAKRLLFVKSILSHAQFITENLEYYGEFSTNHYLADVSGLAILGILFPEFKLSKRWRRLGLREFFEAIRMQVHIDGVHFEGSISYHRFALEMCISVLILCIKNQISIPKLIWDRLEKMFEFVLYYTKPNGMSPQIGDTDNGRLQALSQNEVMDHRYLLAIGTVLFERGDFKVGAEIFHEEALWLLGEEGLSRFDRIESRPAPLPSRSFGAAGIYVMRNKELFMAVDAGQNGLGGIGNHCHNDTFSFELYAYDKTFIVDPGTFVYTADPMWRNLFRSTAYHNTVVVDDEEMNSITDELFRLGNNAIPKVNMWFSNSEIDFLDVQHNGYERLVSPVTHRRQFYFNKAENYWVIGDVLSGCGQHELAFYFHFDSGLDLSIRDDLAIETLCQAGANLIVQPVSRLKTCLKIEQGWISPSYGLKKKAQVVRYSCSAEVPLSVIFVIYPYINNKKYPSSLERLRKYILAEGVSLYEYTLPS